MKFYQVLLVVCVAVSYVKADEVTKETIKTIFDECKAETHSTMEEQLDVFKPQPSKDQTEKCLRGCMMKKLEVLDDKNHMIKDRATEIVTKLSNGDENLKKIGESFIAACSGIAVPDDICEAAETYNLCMVETAKGTAA